MEKLRLCRVCLAGNVRMYVVINNNLRELYEKLTDNPFVTEDSRPMLACFFCCTKLQQCYKFQRKCLEAEELFAQMMNEDYEGIPLINQDHSEYFNGLIQSSVELISIDGECQTENIAIQEELPAVCERQDNVEPKEEHQSDELGLKNQENRFLDVKNIPALQSESDSEEDKLLLDFKIEVEEHEVSRNKWRASGTQQIEHDNVDFKSYPNVEDTPALHAESESEDEPLMEVKINVEDAQESTGAPVAKKPKMYTRRPKPRDSISAEQKKNEYNRKLYAISKITMKSQNRIANLMTEFNKAHTKTQHGVCSSINNTALGTSFHNRKREKTKKYFECDVHQRSLKDNGNLVGHTRTHTGEKPFNCDICQRSFNFKCNLVSHIRTHTGEKPFNCIICKRSFKQKCQLISHTRTHTDQKSYNCDICQRSFNLKCNLVSHIRTHTGLKPFNCIICQRSFNQKSNLVNHIRIHTGEKPFNCDICQRSFKQKGQLLSHTRTHTGEKPYNCDICQRSFIQKSILVRHTRLIHTRFTHKGNLTFDFTTNTL